MMKKSKQVLIVLIAIAHCALFTFISVAHASPAGRVSFDDLSKSYGEAKVAINLNATMLGFVTKLAKGQNADLQQVLSSIENIAVRVYNINDAADEALKAMEKMAVEIKKNGWVSIVSINENEEKLQIYTKMTNDKMDGLVVMVVNGQEAVFINIVGEIDPSDISKVTNSLNLEINSGN